GIALRDHRQREAHGQRGDDSLQHSIPFARPAGVAGVVQEAAHATFAAQRPGERLLVAADQRSFGCPMGEEAGSFVSVGFCASVGWPVTSPGRDDMPGSRLVPLLSSVVLGLAGRATLPAEPWSAGGLTLPRVSFVVPVVLCGADGDAGLVFVSSADGVSEGEVFARCMLLSPLRPCELRRLFLTFLSLDDELGTDSVELPAAESPLFTLPE